MKLFSLSTAALALAAPLLAAPAPAAAQGAGRTADAWFYCLGLNPETGAIAASNVFPGQPTSLDVYKQQIASYLISLDLLPETGGEVACAWAADEAAAREELQSSISPSDVRFAYAPQTLGGGLTPPAAAAAAPAASSGIVREPNALELPPEEVAAIRERNRQEAERAARLEAEWRERQALQQAAYDAERAAYEAAQAAYQAEQAAYQAEQEAYQQELARQQAAQAAYEAQRAAYEAGLQAAPY